MSSEFAVKRSRGGLRRLGTYLKPELFGLTVCFFLALVVNATVLLKPWIIKSLIDDHLTQGVLDPNSVLWLGVGYFGVVLVGALVGYAQTTYMTLVGQRVLFHLRTDLFAHVQKLGLPFFDKTSTGRILTRISNDVEALSEIFSGLIVNLIRDAILIVGLVVMMFLLDARLAWIAISSIPLIVAVTLVYRVLARKNFVGMKGTLARINGFLAENISGMKLVQIFHREKEKHDELKGLDREYFRFSLREVILNSYSRPIVDVINNLTIALLLWYCLGQGLSTGPLGAGVAIGVLYAFISYIKQFFEPISAIAEQYTTIQSALVSADRIFEIFDTTENLEDVEAGLPVPKLRGEIEFRHVWFAYHEENWVLKDVSFKVDPGQTVAFVGTTGSGKSTIISLLARFYDIQKGSIFIDGVDIGQWRLAELRRRISVVIQDVFLFAGDIASNIRLNEVSISDEAVKQAARSVHADRFIEALPGGWNAQVRERGCTFSAGQRQLVSFARAVAFDPSILVLDEATANIDTETETAIRAALETISKDRTTIIIAHRLSTIRTADNIFVLKDGRIVESGTHQDLLPRQGAYTHFYQAQHRRT